VDEISGFGLFDPSKVCADKVLFKLGFRNVSRTKVSEQRIRDLSSWYPGPIVIKSLPVGVKFSNSAGSTFTGDEMKAAFASYEYDWMQKAFRKDRGLKVVDVLRGKFLPLPVFDFDLVKRNHLHGSGLRHGEGAEEPINDRAILFVDGDGEDLIRAGPFDGIKVDGMARVR